MRNVLILALAAFAAWFGYTQYQERSRDPGENSGPKAFESSPLDTSRCDGRTRCAQMTSCEEATYFIRNCPNTTMDGDNDGVPCEQQWCH